MDLRNILAHHVFKIRHQFKQYRSIKENVAYDKAVFHVDFSENYNCKYNMQVQSCHFGGGNEQATLHTGVIYGWSNCISFATVSLSKRHDPIAIWAYMKPVLENLRLSEPPINIIHFFSDGPTQQYRNKLNFYLFSTQLYDLGFTRGTWNMFESGHGKGAPDAIGGTLKRKADNIVNQGHDLPNAYSVYEVLSKESNIQLHFVDEDYINQMEVNSLPSLSPITRTMKFHQICTESRDVITYRNFSCFCKNPIICDCYDSHAYDYNKLFQDNDIIKALPSKPTLQQKSQKVVHFQSTCASSFPAVNLISATTDKIMLLCCNNDAIGKWCLLKINSALLPAEIINIVDNVVEAQTLKCAGKNSFISQKEKAFHYASSLVISMIPVPLPTTKSGRLVAVQEDIWHAACVLSNVMN